jgi:undecaprenyl diphosphate synthase
VAIIMDGNGRWARSRGKPRLAGHRAGTENIRRVIQRFADYGVEYLTLYAFSTENWERPPYEVRGLMRLLSLPGARPELHGRHPLVHSGPLAAETKLQQKFATPSSSPATTQDDARDRIQLRRRAEIVEAVRRINTRRSPEESRGLVAGYMNQAPDPDLVIPQTRCASQLPPLAECPAEFYSVPLLADFDAPHIDGA